MKSFRQYVENRDFDNLSTTPRDMRVNRPGNFSIEDAYQLIDQLKKPNIQMAVGKILEDEPQSKEFLKNILKRALRYASTSYDTPQFPGWSGNYGDSEKAASNFVS